LIENEEHRADLIRMAREYKYSAQSYPKDENEEPIEEYLEYLSLMYDPEIIKIMLEFPIMPSSISIRKVAKKLNIEVEELIKKLEPLAKRGFVTTLGKRYSRLSPLQIHDLPFMLQENIDREDVVDFARLSREYFDGGYYKTWETSRRGIPRTRVLTVSEEVESNHQIIPKEEVYKILEKQTDIVVFPCPCRERKEVEGLRKCKDKYPINNCINYGIFAKGLLEIGDPAVKRITIEEAKKITKEAAELGLVHMTDNFSDEGNVLCACCECCCGNLAGLVRFKDNPRAFARANYISNVDEDACVACGTCVERCKFEAITVEDYAEISTDSCVGCGLCAVTCPEEAITMKRYEKEVYPETRRKI
jgi:formate hydrogenlyase subunit 6/NADH:ubiquinone oxidoreductase subunit I